MRSVSRPVLLIMCGLIAGSFGSSPGSASKDAPAIRVSLAIPLLCNAQNGSTITPKFLATRYGTEQLPVVIENVSSKPIQIWNEGNSIGDFTLTFEVKSADGTTVIARPTARTYTKNAFCTDRLLPGEKHVRLVSYVAPTQWQGFPMPADGKSLTVTVRAIFTQEPVPANKNAELWSGTVMSVPQEVTFTR